jgi:undecaprenyl-diphosphatase
VAGGETRQIDMALLLALRDPRDSHVPVGPPWLAHAAQDVTALGGFAVLTLLTTAAVGYLALARRFLMLAFLMLASIGGTALSMLLKGVFARPRPDVVPHLVQVSSPSFPSGHSMLSAVIYLTLGTLLARVVTGYRFKVYIVTVALCASFLVGLTRVYLGVHYPSDVLAGWIVGLTWGTGCWLVSRWLERRGAALSAPQAEPGLTGMKVAAMGSAGPGPGGQPASAERGSPAPAGGHDDDATSRS